MKNNIGKNVSDDLKVITLTMGILTAMLLSRSRTLDEYGTYSQLLINTTLANLLFTLGLTNSTNFFISHAESGEGRRKFLSVFYFLSMVISIIIGVVLTLTISLPTAYFENKQIAYYTFFLAVFPWTSIIIGSISNVLVVYGKTKKLMLVNVVSSLITLFLLIKLVRLIDINKVVFDYAGPHFKRNRTSGKAT